MSQALTPRQLEALRAIFSIMEETSLSPTWREIAERLGVTSMNTIRCLLDPLVAKGMITMGGRSSPRSIVVTLKGLSALGATNGLQRRLDGKLLRAAKQYVKALRSDASSATRGAYLEEMVEIGAQLQQIEEGRG